MTNISEISGAELKSFVNKIEALERDKAHIADLIKDAFSEAKSHGFDVKILRQLIKIRKINKADLAEQEELLELYLRALEE